MRIDLNCDMGESFGAYTIGADEALMSLITSANIACGFHAGDSHVMQHTVQLAIQHGVALGAHPGFRDLEGFGRRGMDATPDEIESDVLYQIGALDGFARAAGKKLMHVKPHGALYNLAAVKPQVARAIANAVKRFDSHLIFVGLAGSAMIDVARESGLRIAREGFCDRVYAPDGKLMPRREENSLITDPQLAARQAWQMVSEQTVTAASGEQIPMLVDTLCIHGDSPNAPAIARAVREKLEKNGVLVSAFGR
jgi:UPF0271 protein